jgi:hypothetical protein
MRAHEQFPQYQTPHIVGYHVRHAEQEETMSEKIDRLLRKARELAEKNTMDDETLDDLL